MLFGRRHLAMGRPLRRHRKTTIPRMHSAAAKGAAHGAPSPAMPDGACSFSTPQGRQDALRESRFGRGAARRRDWAAGDGRGSPHLGACAARSAAARLAPAVSEHPGAGAPGALRPPAQCAAPSAPPAAHLPAARPRPPRARPARAQRCGGEGRRSRAGAAMMNRFRKWLYKPKVSAAQTPTPCDRPYPGAATPPCTPRLASPHYPGAGMRLPRAFPILSPRGADGTLLPEPGRSRAAAPWRPHPRPCPPRALEPGGGLTGCGAGVGRRGAPGALAAAPVALRALCPGSCPRGWCSGSAAPGWGHRGDLGRARSLPPRPGAAAAAVAPRDPGTPLPSRG